MAAMNAMYLMIGVLCVLAIAYRYYSAFIAAKVLTLDDLKQTPAHTMTDGQNYHPTNKWVLFGHHFAAISGAGPLIGPVLAAQFGYLPGLLWILIGVTLGGAVQDFIILGLSIRRGGKSLAQIAYQEVGGASGRAATIGILFVLVIALAGLGRVVVEALAGKVVAYPAGTKFVAPPAAPLTSQSWNGNINVYRIERRTQIVYPAGKAAPGAAHAEPVTEIVPERFEITAVPANPADGKPDLDVSPGKLKGSVLLVTPNVIVTRRFAGSTWGTFTIFLTIPIALFVGWYMYRFRKGKVLEASAIGGLLTLGAVYLGSHLDPTAVDPMTGVPLHFLAYFRPYFDLSEHGISLSMAIYGFAASVMPVWVLLCPRDYLSSFLKIGTLALLVLGVIIAHPTLHAPALNYTFLAGGPIVKAPIFPFVFITIMCGAISGFHALVSSGTTPKMISKESDARMIGYGAMLVEGLVAVVALIAAASLPSAHYYHMNTMWKDLPTYQQQIAELAQKEDQADVENKQPVSPPLAVREHQMHETLRGRTGGAVTLAVGMAGIFDNAAKNILGTSAEMVQRIEEFMPYWYHFAIMFEALFILTTIDTGTRVGRFLLQEVFGKFNATWGKPGWWPGAIVATGLMVGGWWYFINSNSMDTIWPMFGIANQMLAVMALAVASAALVRGGKGRYAWVTLGPMLFVSITTTTAAVYMLMGRVTILRTSTLAAERFNAIVSGGLIVAIVTCTAIIVIGSIRRMVVAAGMRTVVVASV
jgi:carbon starvation protein